MPAASPVAAFLPGSSLHVLALRSVAPGKPTKPPGAESRPSKQLGRSAALPPTGQARSGAGAAHEAHETIQHAGPAGLVLRPRGRRILCALPPAVHKTELSAPFDSTEGDAQLR